MNIGQIKKIFFRGGSNTQPRGKHLFLFLPLVLLFTLTLAFQASAATFTVDTLADTPGANVAGQRTLRWAINNAASGDTIKFATTLPNLGTINITSPLNTGTKTIIIDGGTKGIVIDASSAGTNGALSGTGTITLNNKITIKSATKAVTTAGTAAQAWGGAINIDTLKVSNDRNYPLLIKDNKAEATVNGGAGDAEAHGGGMYVDQEIIGNIFVNSENNKAEAKIIGGTGKATARGGNAYFKTGILSSKPTGTVTGIHETNLASASSISGDAKAEGGAIWAANLRSTNRFSTKFISNKALAVSISGNAEASGGAIYREDLSGFAIAGEYTGNIAEARSQTGSALAKGGAAYSHFHTTSLGVLTPKRENNRAIAQSNSGSATAQGGSAYLHQGVSIIQGPSTSNSAEATTNSSSATALAQGGAVYTGNLGQYSSGTNNGSTGDFTTNRAEATNTSGAAIAQGGALFIANANGISSIAGGDFKGNIARATGNTARAEGGAIFVGTSLPNMSTAVLELYAANNILFENNQVIANGVSSNNDIHFGRINGVASIRDAELNILGPSSGKSVSIKGGITVDMNNGKNFTLTKSEAATFNWGGQNTFVTTGGTSQVNLTGGKTNLLNNFALTGSGINVSNTGILSISSAGANSAVNMYENLEVNNGGSLQFNSSTNNTTLLLNNKAINLNSGATLSFRGKNNFINSGATNIKDSSVYIALGSQLQFDANSPLNLENAKLNLDVRNEFGGSNTPGTIKGFGSIANTGAKTHTINLLNWRSGAVGVATVLDIIESATLTLAADFHTYFTNLQINSNTVVSNADFNIFTQLDATGKKLQIVTERLRGNEERELTLGGNWDYQTSNWSPSSTISKSFMPGDAAKLALASGNYTLNLGGQSIFTGGIWVTNNANYTLNASALHFDSKAALNLPASVNHYKGMLLKEGTGKLTLATGATRTNPNKISKFKIENGTLELAGGSFTLRPEDTQTDNSIVLTDKTEFLVSGARDAFDNLTRQGVLLNNSNSFFYNTELTIDDGKMEIAAAKKLEIRDAYNTTFKNRANMNMQSGSALTLSPQAGYNLTIDSDSAFNMLNANVLTLNTGDLNILNGGSLNINAGTIKLADGDINLTAGKLAFSGDNTIFFKEDNSRVITLNNSASTGSVLSVANGNTTPKNTTIKVKGSNNIGTANGIRIKTNGVLTIDNTSNLEFGEAGKYSKLNIDLNNGTTTGKIIVQNTAPTALTIAGNNTVNVENWDPSKRIVSSIVESANNLTAAMLNSFNNFQINGVNTTDSFEKRIRLLLDTTGKKIYLVVSKDYNDELTWTGASNNIWSSNLTDTNWTVANSNINVFQGGDAVLFKSTAAQNITLGSDITMNGMKIDGAANYTITGNGSHALTINAASNNYPSSLGLPAIDYSGKLLMNGTGILTLNTGTAQNKINMIDVAKGTLVLGDGFKLAHSNAGTSATVDVKNAATLKLAGASNFTKTNLNIRSGGKLNFDPNSSLRLDNDSLLTLNQGTTTYVGSASKTLAVTGTGTLKQKGGTLRVDASSNMELDSGLMTLDGATASFNNIGKLQFVNNSTLNLTNNATMNLVGSGNLELAGSTINMTGSNLSLNNNLLLANNSKLVLAGINSINLGAAKNITVDNTGKINISSGTSTLTGGTIALDGGTLHLSSDSSELRLNASGKLNFNNAKLTTKVGASNAGKITTVNPGNITKTTGSSNILNLENWVAGTHTIFETSGTFANNVLTMFDSFTIGGNIISSTGDRIKLQLDSTKTKLEVALTNNQNYELTWTGAIDSVWNYSTNNWDKPSAHVNEFFIGDAALFNSASGGTITLADNPLANVSANGVKVTGAGNFIFNGGGLVITSAGSNLTSPIDYSEKLVFDGTGSLTMNNQGVSSQYNMIPHLIVKGGGTVTLNTGQYNKIDLIDVTNGTLKFDDGFAMAHSNTGTSAIVNVGSGHSLFSNGNVNMNQVNLNIAGNLELLANSMLKLDAGSNLILNSGSSAFFNTTSGVQLVDNTSRMTMNTGSSLKFGLPTNIFSVASGNVTLENGIISLGTGNAMYLDGKMMINSSGNANLTGSDLVLADNSSFEVTPSSSFSLADNLLLSGNSSSFKVNAGTLNMTGSGKQMNLSGQNSNLILNSGIVNMGGNDINLSGTQSKLSVTDDSSINNGKVTVNSGNILSVDNGKTLTLDPSSTLNMKSGSILSLGIDSNGTSSAQIVSNNPSNAPVFEGNHILDLHNWELGTYTILRSALAFDPTLHTKFTGLTVGGVVFTGGRVDYVLQNSGQDLVISTSADNLEMYWTGNTNNVWDGSTDNWKATDIMKNDTKFSLKDAVVFDDRGTNTNIIMAGSILTQVSGMYVDSSKDYTFTGVGLNIDSTGVSMTLPSYADSLVKSGTGALRLNTSGLNKIARIDVNNGTLAFGDGFQMEHVTSGLSSNININNGSNLYMYGSGNFIMTDINMNANSSMYLAGGNTVLLDSNSNLTFAPGTTLDVNLRGLLPNSGIAALKLNNPAGTDFSGTTLRLRHTGTQAENGDWLVYDGVYNIGGFSDLVIATATLKGNLDLSNPNQILFTGTYTPIINAPGMDHLPPNAQNAWPGFGDMMNEGRTDFMNDIDQFPDYANQEVFLGDLQKNMHSMTAESAVNQGSFSITTHTAVASMSHSYAFGFSAPVSSSTFVPMNFMSSGPQMLDRIDAGHLARQDHAVSKSLQASRLDRMMQNPNTMSNGNGYSIINSYRPTSEYGRSLLRDKEADFMELYTDAVKERYNGLTFWGGYLGNFSKQQNRKGYSGYDSHHNGFLLGASYDFTPEWNIGVYGSYTSGDTKYNMVSASIDTNTTHVGIFARYRDQDEYPGLDIIGDLLYSYSDNDSTRHVDLLMGRQTMKASFDQHIIGGGIEAGYDMYMDEQMLSTMTPFFGLRYMHLEQEGYSESGNLGLRVRSTNTDVLTSSLGMKYEYDFIYDNNIVFTPKTMVSWMHNWGDTNTSTTTNFIGSPVTFRVKSIKQKRDAAQLGLGFDMRSKKVDRWDIGLKGAYGVTLRRYNVEQNIFGGFELRF